jgi:hypothetical protein
LAGQRLLGRQPTTGQLEERIVPQGSGIVLILIATGELEDPLPDEGLQGVLDRAGSPVRDLSGQGGTETKGGICFGEPDQPTV